MPKSYRTKYEQRALGKLGDKEIASFDPNLSSLQITNNLNASQILAIKEFFAKNDKDDKNLISIKQELLENIALDLENLHYEKKISSYERYLINQIYQSLYKKKKLLDTSCEIFPEVYKPIEKLLIKLNTIDEYIEPTVKFSSSFTNQSVFNICFESTEQSNISKNQLTDIIALFKVTMSEKELKKIMARYNLLETDNLNLNHIRMIIIGFFANLNENKINTQFTKDFFDFLYTRKDDPAQEITLNDIYNKQDHLLTSETMIFENWFKGLYRLYNCYKFSLNKDLSDGNMLSYLLLPKYNGGLKFYRDYCALRNIVKVFDYQQQLTINQNLLSSKEDLLAKRKYTLANQLTVNEHIARNLANEWHNFDSIVPMLMKQGKIIQYKVYVLTSSNGVYAYAYVPYNLNESQEIKVSFSGCDANEALNSIFLQNSIPGITTYNNIRSLCLLELNKVITQVNQFIGNNEIKPKLTITGHQVGGTLASLLMHDLCILKAYISYREHKTSDALLRKAIANQYEREQNIEHVDSNQREHIRERIYNLKEQFTFIESKCNFLIKEPNLAILDDITASLISSCGVPTNICNQFSDALSLCFEANKVNKDSKFATIQEFRASNDIIAFANKSLGENIPHNIGNSQLIIAQKGEITTSLKDYASSLLYNMHSYQDYLASNLEKFAEYTGNQTTDRVFFTHGIKEFTNTVANNFDFPLTTKYSELAMINHARYFANSEAPNIECFDNTNHPDHGIKNLQYKYNNKKLYSLQFTITAIFNSIFNSYVQIIKPFVAFQNDFPITACLKNNLCKLIDLSKDPNIYNKSNMLNQLKEETEYNLKWIQEINYKDSA